jgi:putative flippase GtrA
MKRFLHSQISSFIATVIDFGLSYLLKAFTGLGAVTCSALGTIAGGIINFLINRNWVFKDRKGNVWKEALLYFVFWLIYFVMVQFVVHLFEKYTTVPFHYSKLIASTIGAVFNYIMQHTFVFGKKKEIVTDEPV